MYSEEQLYQLIGEKNSMKRLLTEVGGSAGPDAVAMGSRWLLHPLPFVCRGWVGWAALCYTPVPHLEGRSWLVLSRCHSASSS